MVKSIIIANDGFFGALHMMPIQNYILTLIVMHIIIFAEKSIAQKIAQNCKFNFSYSF